MCARRTTAASNVRWQRRCVSVAPHLCRQTLRLSCGRGLSDFADEDHHWNFIVVDNAADVWVSDVTGAHFASSVVSLWAGAKRATVQDCTSVEPVSGASGGRRFTYCIAGQFCLVQRCRSDHGRHSFVIRQRGDSIPCGPNVFSDCVATRPLGSSEPHSNLITGTPNPLAKGCRCVRYD